MNTESEQPTILPWHMDAAKQLSTLAEGQAYEYHSQEDFATIIARHDPHAAQHKCTKCDGDMCMTPVCIHCGTIPIAENDFAELKAQHAETLRLLEWYGEQARLCRLIHSEGDAGRHALAADGGAKARAHIAAHAGERNQMSTKRIKAQTVMGWNIEHPKLDGPTMHYVLPADAESYERMVEQGQKDASKYAENFAPKEGLLCHIKRAAYESGFRDGCLTQLRAIGITPRTGRGGKGTK